MNKFFLLFVCCITSFVASAVVTIFPSSMSAPYGGATQTICQNKPNVATTVFYSVCGTSVAGSALVATPTWYLGGVPVYTGGPVTISAAGGNITLPAAAFTYSTIGTFTGATGLYCQLDWTGASPCGGVTSVISSTTTINVVESPTPITGPATVCTGLTTTLNSTPTGGVWTSGSAVYASVAFGTGVVTGNAAGTANITYTIGSGCFVAQTVTVTQTPAAITGSINLCTNAVNTLHDATLGGVWSSSNTGVATIGSATGTMTNIAAGTTTISYTINTGCQSTITVTVNQAPSVITGIGEMCVGAQTTLSDTAIGGNWTSASPGIASVVFNTGVVTGVAAGTARITYTLSSGCAATTIVTVDALPAPISGNLNVCVNALTILSDASTGGFWTTSNANVAVGTGSGFAATGVTAGLDTVYYTLSPSGCFRSAVITVNPLPAAIGGTLAVCAGGTTALTDITTGGIWSSSNTSVVTIISSTGVASGIAAGTSTITYKLGTGCLITSPITVNPLPAAITGSAYLCVGVTATLSDVSSGGTWSSNNLSVATIVAATGDVTGVSPGSTTITYTLGTGCTKTFTVTVNALPSVISGAGSVCTGATISLTDATSGGAWTSSTTSVATVSVGGLVNGVASGTTTITYKIPPTGCYSTHIVTVNSVPNNVTGNPKVCVGSVTALSDVTTGGTWSSTNTAVATVDASGNVTGVTSGTAIISYYLSTGCSASLTVTVSPLPSAISGLDNVCTGSVITLSDIPTGGTWVSTNTGVATISVTGVVSAIAAGTTMITYTLPTGCQATKQITVNPLPLAISGTTNVCVGGTTQLTDGTGGGAWTSSSLTKATVDASGLVTGVASGTTTITYSLSTGCLKTTVVTVNPLPASISGTLFVCEGSTTSLGDASLSGVWSSGTISVATISASGVVTGVSAGTSVVSYTLPTSCASSVVVTVNPLPAPVTGTQIVCVGSSITLSDATPGGIWNSSYTPVATVAFGTGVVTGIASGTANITYTLPTNCKSWATVTVNALPAAISGPVSVCIGSTITITDANTGGTWSSNDPSVATIGAGTGIIVGVSTGTVMMTYTLGTGCIRTININVNPLPTTVLGAGNVCVGQTVTLTDATPGGTWTSGNIPVATAGLGTGVITGISSGTAKITYTLSSGCFTTSDMVVNPTPPVITGVPFVCIGQTTTLSDGLFVGTWSSANTAVATIDAGGVVTGVAAGTATISYIAAVGGCYRISTVTVRPLPSPITGATSVCTGSTASVADATLGGSWSSSTPAIASIAGGTITPVAPGTTTITYTLSTGCYITSTITVNPSPLVITGANNACVGFSATLSDITPAGTWSSSNTAIASVDASLGVVTGASAGSATITYTLSTGCKQTYGFTVFALPAPITGVNFVCEALTTTLHDITAGGVWSSDNGAVATISASGVVTGVSLGTANISYVTAAGCPTSIVVSVNPFPSPIDGTLSVCAGATTALSDAAMGGQWTSSNTAKVTIGLLSGVATGVAAGTATVTYTMGTGCIATAQVTVNSTPPAISGASTLCNGLATLFSDALPGGAWTSGDITKATVGIGTGNVVGMDTGTVTISYTVGLCGATKNITITQTPSAIYNALDAGVFSLCSGVTLTLADSVASGTWSSSNTAVATIGISTGVLSGISAGTTNITYSLGTGCLVSKTVTVNTNPGPIMGAANVCPNATITLSDAVGSGTWTSDNLAIATISVGSGVVTGISAGVVNITYSLGVGCSVTTTVNVNAAPSAILGTLGLCAGTTTALSDTTAGGIWTSSKPASVPVDISTGLVSGVNADTAVITYRILSSGCFTTAIVTVNPNPTTILGATNTCVGQSTLLTDATLFGTWSSDNLGVASVGPGTGIVTGVDSGFATITYMLGTGCYTTTLFRVNLASEPVTGSNTVCEGSIVVLSDTTPFGTWLSSNTSIAIANPVTGEISGISAGTATVTYQLGTGCYATYEMTVTPLPAPIVGPLYVCMGANIFLSDATPGGAWTSSDPTVATVDGIGNVIGFSVGVSTLTYALPSGCFRTQLITVNANPTPIVGDSVVCAGFADTLTSTPLGGTWTSSNTAIATVGVLSGYVVGAAPGVVTISYTSLAGCTVRRDVTVDAVPVPIVGLDSLCPGLTTSLFEATGGGTWSSSDPTIATVDGLGNVTAILSGTTIISYTFLSPLPACSALVHFKVEPLPYIGSITGVKTVCQADSTALADSVAGGVWTSASTLFATVDSATGMVTGVGPGTTTITYIVTQQCGMDTATTTVTINPLPFAGPILGFTQLCAHYTTSLSDTTAGGVWSSSNLSIASVDATTGLVTGNTGGTAIISYIYTNSCGAYSSTQMVTINEAFGFGHIVTFPDTPLCANSLFRNFGVESPAPSGISYAWSASNAQIFDTSSNGQYAIVSFHNPGTAVVRLSSVILSSGCAITDSFVVNIGTDTAVNTRVQYYLSEFVCTDNTADNYQWGYDDIMTKDSAIIRGQVSQAYFNASPDTMRKNYWVMSNKGGCWQKTYYHYNTVTAVSEVNAQFEINLFPNPADSRVNIVVTGTAWSDVIDVRVMDAMGRDVQTTTLTGGKGGFSVSELPSGVYSVLLTRDGMRIGTKMFVKN